MTDQRYPDLATYFDETGITQEDFAEQLDISASYLSRIKNNLAEPPIELALKICKAAGIPIESLIREAQS